MIASLSDFRVEVSRIKRANLLCYIVYDLKTSAILRPLLLGICSNDFLSNVRAAASATNSVLPHRLTTRNRRNLHANVGLYSFDTAVSENVSIIADAINSAHRGEISKVANKLYQNTFGENTRQSARSFFDGLMGTCRPGPCRPPMTKCHSALSDTAEKVALASSSLLSPRNHSVDSPSRSALCAQEAEMVKRAFSLPVNSAKIVSSRDISALDSALLLREDTYR